MIAQAFPSQDRVLTAAAAAVQESRQLLADCKRSQRAYRESMEAMRATLEQARRTLRTIRPA